MALQSALFRGDHRLERCLVENSAHVKLKDSGDFVTKIQEALIIVDNAIFTGTDVSTKTYGKSTSDNVLDFKNTRQIINRTYQQFPDDIVGKMTIKQLDTEMAAKEQLMPEMMQRARLGAFQRTFAAFMRVVGIGPTPPPGRPDPGLANRLQARLLAEAIFNDTNPDMDFIGEVLGDMRNRVASPSLPMERAPLSDPRCGLRSAFVVGNRIPIHLCPGFFGTSDENRIRTLIHESAHLSGIGDPDGELY